MDFITLTIEFLKTLSNIVGSYGIGIILLTVIIRVILWPFGVSQQRSMKVMQELQPKLKMIQDRYKNDPQAMQRKMMEFYKEHKFNPMSGCLPMLIQLPIFILLYSALMSPQFIQMAGDSKFLFINRLDSTLRGNAGISYDGTFNVSKNDIFSISKNAIVYLGDKEFDDVKFNSKKALKVQGEVTPGEPIDFKISLDELDLKYSQLEKVTKAKIDILNNSTREIENIDFIRDGSILKATMPTVAVKSTFNLDVFVLIVIFGATMFITQKIMMSANKNQKIDPSQEAMQKTMGTMMPIMLTATFIFIPIPAGVLLYLISSNIIQVIQTIVINKQLENEALCKKQNRNNSSENKNKNNNKVLDSNVIDVKPITDEEKDR